MPPAPPQSVRSEPQAGPSAAPQRTRRRGAVSAPSSEAGDSSPGHLTAARYPGRTRNPPGEWWKVQPSPSPESSPAPEPSTPEPASAEDSEDEVTSSVDTGSLQQLHQVPA